MALAHSELQAAVEREVTRYGSLDLAIEALRIDADGARWGAPVHDVLKAALAEKSARRPVAQSKAA